MAKNRKQKPKPKSESQPKPAQHRPEPEGGPFARQKAFVDERRHTLGPKRQDAEEPREPDAEGGNPRGEENCGKT